MAKTKSKKQIIADLVEHTGVDPDDCEMVLDAIVEIACAEAVNGFRIPGLCRFYTVDQKARYGRNPRTGERILIKARKSLKVSPLKKAKDKIAELPVDPAIAAIEPSVPAVAPATVAGAAAAPPAAEAPAAPEAPAAEPSTWQADFADPEVAWLTFNCRHCQQEIEASEDLAGATAACPGCGAEVMVPRSREEAAQEHLPFDVMAGASDEPGAKRKTMRIDLSLDDLDE